MQPRSRDLVWMHDDHMLPTTLPPVVYVGYNDASRDHQTQCPICEGYSSDYVCVGVFVTMLINCMLLIITASLSIVKYHNGQKICIL